LDNLYFYKAIIRSVYDGDTATADIDLGFNCWMKNEKLRFYGIHLKSGALLRKKKKRRSRLETGFASKYLIKKLL